jgi:hypothetical protein
VKAQLDATFDFGDPYRTLGVAASATTADVRKAYLALAKQYHPNLFATDPVKYRAMTVVMQEINAAYRLLRDPALREFWDRGHSVAPQATTPRQREVSKYYNSELVRLVNRKYNAFVRTLRTSAAWEDAIRKIRGFQVSREGSAYIKELVVRHYSDVMGLLKLGRRISVYYDGLVDMIFLYPGALEVAPSSIFITYAYLLHKENNGGFPDGLGTKRPAQGPDAPTVRLKLPAPIGQKSAESFGSKVWEWLMAKPGSGKR